MAKAQLSIHFHWLFILIIAVIIMAFFFTTIKNNQERATTTATYELTETLQTLLDESMTKEDTVQTITMDKTYIRYTCEPGLSNYVVEETTIVPTTNDLLFTPQETNGNKLITWTRTWRIPYEAATFTYLADERTKFIFVTDDETIKELYLALPGNYTKKETTSEDLEQAFSEGAERYIIIAGQEQTIPQAYQERTTQRIITQSSVTFTAEGQVRSYSSTEELWGAIFAGDPVMYDCAMDKAFLQLSITAEVLKGRANRLASDLEDSPCSTYLTNARQPFALLAAGNLAAAETLQRLDKQQREGHPLCPSIY